jgi:hypothetical protein
MEWDTTTVALVISSLVTLFGIIPQILQSLSFSRSDKERVKNEQQNSQAQGMAQFAGATQAIQGASAILINELQEEAQVLRSRNTELRGRAEVSEGARLEEHLAGKKMLNDLILLRERHQEEFAKKQNCPYGKTLDRKLELIIKRYEPVFANGLPHIDNDNPITDSPDAPASTPEPPIEPKEGVG